MSPWLLFIILLTSAGPQYGVMPVENEQACYAQMELVRAQVAVPTQMACYQLAPGA